MNDLIKFICKWFVPIGFVELIARSNDKIFTIDSVNKQTYWRLSDAKSPIVGAGVLIRRT
jgi:hypothetical protein